MTKDEFIPIWEELLPGLKNFALKLSSYNVEDSEDLVQETYIKVQMSLDKFDSAFSLKTWVYSLANNKFIDDWRKKKRRAPINNRMPTMSFNNEEDKHVKEIVSDSNLGESSFVLSDILAAVEKLEEKEKRPFKMLLDGYQYDEIANELDQPIGTIKVRIFAARRKLWNFLKEYSDVSCKFKK